MRGQAKGGHKRLQLICNAFLNNNKKKTKKKNSKERKKAEAGISKHRQSLIPNYVCMLLRSFSLSLTLSLTFSV